MSCLKVSVRAFIDSECLVLILSLGLFSRSQRIRIIKALFFYVRRGHSIWGWTRRDSYWWGTIFFMGSVCSEVSFTGEFPSFCDSTVGFRIAFRSRSLRKRRNRFLGNSSSFGEIQGPCKREFLRSALRLSFFCPSLKTQSHKFSTQILISRYLEVLDPYGWSFWSWDTYSQTWFALGYWW